MKNICVFTGTRAEYGLLYWIMKDIAADEQLNLQILVSGSHLSPEFGETVNQIEKEFEVDEKVEMLLSSNSSVGIVKSIGLGVIGYADSLARIKPDCIVVLGDRYEALAIAQASLVIGIPIVHIHGGEITEGAYDDALRHSISKMSHLHFASTNSHRRRLLQMGEQPYSVFNFGAPGLDWLKRIPLKSLQELKADIGFNIDSPFFLITYHPVTLDNAKSLLGLEALLNALSYFDDVQYIITYPNADNGSRDIMSKIDQFKQRFLQKVFVTKSLGQINYLSALKTCEVVIGNSSSGIIEAPSFKRGSVNIGSRQLGRECSESVVHSTEAEEDIVASIEKARGITNNWDSEKYVNPYDAGGASAKIVDIIKGYDFKKTKHFYEIGEL